MNDAKLLRAIIRAQMDLLRAYRVGSRPKEKSLDLLADNRDLLEDIRGEKVNA